MRNDVKWVSARETAIIEGHSRDVLQGWTLEEVIATPQQIK